MYTLYYSISRKQVTVKISKNGWFDSCIEIYGTIWCKSRGIRSSLIPKKRVISTVWTDCLIAHSCSPRYCAATPPDSTGHAHLTHRTRPLSPTPPYPTPNTPLQPIDIKKIYIVICFANILGGRGKRRRGRYGGWGTFLGWCYKKQFLFFLAQETSSTLTL